MGEISLGRHEKDSSFKSQQRDGRAEETAGRLSQSCCLPTVLLDEQGECC